MDGKTGEVVCTFQHVRHDIGGYDTPSALTLVDVEKDGQPVPALLQATTQGFLFVLDLRTGEPLFPIEERSVPASDARGEVVAETYPSALAAPPLSIALEIPGVGALASATSF